MNWINYKLNFNEINIFKRYNKFLCYKADSINLNSKSKNAIISNTKSTKKDKYFYFNIK